MTENCSTEKTAASVSSTVLPGTPDSTSEIVYVTGYAAAERRNNRTLMNCFRDRSTAYGRSNSRQNVSSIGSIAESGSSGSGGGGGSGNHSKRVVKQPPPPQATRYMRIKPLSGSGRNNGTNVQLKSASARDLHRLTEQEQSLTEDRISLITDLSTTSTLNSRYSGSTTTSSGSTGSNKATMNNHQSYNRVRRDVANAIGNSTTTAATTSVAHANNNNNHRACLSRSRELEQRLVALETIIQKQNEHAVGMETRVVELTRLLEELTIKVGESKPTQRKKSHRKTGNSTGNVQPSKFTAWINLSNLWKSRPSIETLKQQNIYNDEPCFDTNIQLVLKHETHKTVPKIIADCCELIEEKYRKSPSPIEGIYRQCGDYNRIQTLRFKIDANDYAALRHHSIDIHVLTGLLKLFLREIKQPLISANEAKAFIGKPNQWHLTALNVKIETLKRLIISLPEVNRDTANYLFTHFNRLTKVPLQHVSADTLSISVTPSIFHTVQTDVHMQDIHTLLKESEVLADCVMIMIEYHSRIFGCIAEEWRRTNSISMRRLKKTLSHPDLIFHNLF